MACLFHNLPHKRDSLFKIRFQFLICRVARATFVIANELCLKCDFHCLPRIKAKVQMQMGFCPRACEGGPRSCFDEK